MDREARAELFRINAEAQATLQQDIAERQQRRRDGDFDYENDLPPPRQKLNAGEQVVRKSLQRSDADADFNRWFEDSFRNHVRPHIEAIDAEFDGVEQEFNLHAADIRNITKALGGKENAQGMFELRDISEWIATLDRNFKAELNLMHDMMLKRLGAELDVLRVGMMKDLRKEIVSEIVKMKKALHVKESANVTDIGSVKRK
jgi:hypothetical protein